MSEPSVILPDDGTAPLPEKSFLGKPKIQAESKIVVTFI